MFLDCMERIVTQMGLEHHSSLIDTRERNIDTFLESKIDRRVNDPIIITDRTVVE